jgi:hypothetical protein
MSSSRKTIIGAIILITALLLCGTLAFAQSSKDLSFNDSEGAHSTITRGGGSQGVGEGNRPEMLDGSLPKRRQGD